MKLLLRSKDLDHFYLPWQRLNHIYEDHAKQYDDGATQKELCDTLYFSKQTVDAVIQYFEKKGWSRSIILAEKGKLFRQEAIANIKQAEHTAFAALADLWEKYTDHRIKSIIAGKSDVQERNWYHVKSVDHYRCCKRHRARYY